MIVLPHNVVRKSIEYKQGANHKLLGYSAHYNPYRNKGTSKQFTDWVSGWEDAIDDLFVLADTK